MPQLSADPPIHPTLLARVAQGDADALGELFARHGGEVHRVAYRLTRPAADADDVLQDVFVGLPEALKRFEGRGSFGRWIRRVAARTALMRLRGAGRRREVELPEGDAPSGPAAPGPGIDGLALERALAALPDGLRAVFVLREVEGYSHAEIAETLGIRPGTSEVRLHRARRLLRQALDPR